MEKSKTIKICSVVLILALAGSGGLFADDEVKEKMPMHTITADLAPLVLWGGLGLGLNAISGVSSSGWGGGLQYEFQPFRYFSVAAKGSLMSMNMGVSINNISLDLDFFSWAIELHPRWYPWGKTFFLDGLVGYGNFTTKLDASASILDYGIQFDNKMELNYLKLGGNLGWRVDFGKPGGFIFETTVGYTGGIVLGDKSNFTGFAMNNDKVSDIFEKLDKIRPYAQMVGIDIPDVKSPNFNPNSFINVMNDFLGDYIFVGGPKVTLSFGWRF